MISRSFSRLAAGYGPRPRLSSLGPTIGGAGGQTMTRLGFRAFTIVTALSAVVFIGIIPAATDTWTYLKNNVSFLQPDPEEMD